MAPVWYVDSRGESTMAKSERQKLKLLILRDYLRSHTDEQHPVSMQQILAALEGEGIRAERKSVYDDLDTLRDYGMEIRKVSGKNGGYYVPERDFALSELKLLVDAVQAARFLSEKESMALIRKLAALSSARSGAAAARGRRYRPRQKRQRGRLPQCRYAACGHRREQPHHVPLF